MWMVKLKELCNSVREWLNARFSGCMNFPNERSGSIVQQDILFLIDLPLIFFAPLLSAFIFSREMVECFPEFLLKNMIVFSLTIESSLILFCSYTPSSQNFRRDLIAKLAIPLSVGGAVYYPLMRLLSHFEPFSSTLPSLLICGGLLFAHRYVAHCIRFSPHDFFSKILPRIQSATAKIRNHPQNLSNNILFLDESKKKSTNVLLIGVLRDVDRFVHSHVLDDNFIPVAILTPDAMDFGKYVDDIPVVGCVDFVSECLDDGTFQYVVIVEDSLAPHVISQIEQAASGKQVFIMAVDRQARRKLPDIHSG
jgi:FlaA1/EpsC-like NDP-sugar epimerase